MIKSFVRGGQIALHSLRMFSQVFKITLFVSFLCLILSLGSFTYWKSTSYQRVLLMSHLAVELKQTLQLRKKDKKRYTLPLPQGGKILLTYRRFKQHRFLQKELSIMRHSLTQSLLYGSIISTLFFLVLLSFFIWRGRSKYRDILLRGNHLIDSDTLRKMIGDKGMASDLNIDGLPLIKERETSHILVTGTTGAGKTNLFRTLMPQIRERSNRAIVVDTTGDMVEKFYNPETDLLLNPLDERGISWNLFQECHTQTELEGFAEALIPSGDSYSDSFWDESARVVFTAALNKLKETGDESIQSLSHIFFKSSLTDYEAFFKGTYAASFTDSRADKTTLSIRSNLSSKLLWLRYMKDEEDSFSISKWVGEQNPNQWLFITAQKKDLVALRPIISSWFNLAITSLISLPINDKRRLWFMLDELASLQKLPSLESGLAEGRKYGGCFFAGTQSVSQIKRIYGHQMSQSCLDLFNTRIFFRSNDSETTHWISKTLGDSEIEETQENISYGANTIRDGVSLNHTKRVKSIVLPSEISALENLQCYVKLPEGFPLTKMRLEYKELECRNTGFNHISDPAHTVHV